MTMSKSLSNKKTRILGKIDSLPSFSEKLEYLNSCFLLARSEAEEIMISDMIKTLKFFGC